jgi:hypothetical protein
MHNTASRKKLAEVKQGMVAQRLFTIGNHSCWLGQQAIALLDIIIATYAQEHTKSIHVQQLANPDSSHQHPHQHSLIYT